MKLDKAKNTFAGSNNTWTNALSFGIIGNTIVGIIQMITSFASMFIHKNSSNNYSYNPNYSKSNIRYRVSKYPSSTSVFI